MRVYIVGSDIQVAVFRSGMTRERVARVWTGVREVRETECVPGGHRWDLSSLSWSAHRLDQRLACGNVAKTLERWLSRVLLQKFDGGRQAMAQTPNVVFPPAAGVAIFGWGRACLGTASGCQEIRKGIASKSSLFLFFPQRRS